MYTHRLRPEQIEIVVATLRRHADSSIAEYISSIQGHGSLPFAGLVARFALLNEVATSVPRLDANAPAIPLFDLAEELRKGFERHETAPTESFDADWLPASREGMTDFQTGEWAVRLDFGC